MPTIVFKNEHTSSTEITAKLKDEISIS